MESTANLSTSLSPLGGQAGATGTALLLAEKNNDLPTATKMVTPLSEFISEDARAEIGNIPSDIQKYKEQGLFDPTAGLRQITNKFDERVFAYIHEDENGKRYIRFIQKYEDGTFSPEFGIRQSDLIVVALGNGYQDPEMERDRRKCIKRIRTEYLDKCSGRELANVVEIIAALAEIISELPVYSSRQDMPKEQLYAGAVNALRYSCPETFEHSRRGGYFMLTDMEISKIAHELGMKERKLLEQLKRNRLLYLTESCMGYQVKVPTHKDKNGHAVYEWCYCLLDLEYFSRKMDPKRRDTAAQLNPPLDTWEV